MSNHKLIEAVTKSQLRTDLPTFRSGDTLRVHVRIVEVHVNVSKSSKVL